MPFFFSPLAVFTPLFFAIFARADIAAAAMPLRFRHFAFISAMPPFSRHFHFFTDFIYSPDHDTAAVCCHATPPPRCSAAICRGGCHFARFAISRRRRCRSTPLILPYSPPRRYAATEITISQRRSAIFSSIFHYAAADYRRFHDTSQPFRRHFRFVFTLPLIRFDADFRCQPAAFFFSRQPPPLRLHAIVFRHADSCPLFFHFLHAFTPLMADIDSYFHYRHATFAFRYCFFFDSRRFFFVRLDYR